MIALPAALDVPLRRDEDGVIRVGDSRVTLEIVIAAHLRQETPEQIVSSFDTLKLEEVYAVIAYYLSHQDEVDDYIRQVDVEGEAIRRKFEALHPNQPTREILRTRLELKKRGQE